ncbi:MAG: glycosyltransferase family 4 protein [Crocinitomicaceae bacterium]|nr:glycosyltransferase family 4 protein [Crocinitomicaceae bacterium]
MRVAINTRFLLPTKMEGFGWYAYEISKRLVENHPDVDFVFFFDRPYDQKFVFGANVTPVVLYPQARHPILFKIWFDFSIKRALRKYKPDVFFSPDGYLCLKTNVPQVPVIHDVNFEHHPEDLPKTARNYLQKYFPKFARKASQIITVSNYSKSDISATYGIDTSKIHAIWNGASEVFRPLEKKEQESIRRQYTDGKDYFLFVGALHPRKNLKRLLKAYEGLITNNPSIDTQLVIVGEELWKNTSFDLEISDVIKSRIHFTGHVKLEELAKIMGSAFAFTFVPYFEGFGIPIVEAMKCGTPILSGNLTSLPEVAGDAAIYCDPFDIKDIQQKLLQLSTDASLRTSLSKKSLERSKLFSWDIAAKNVWNVLLKEIENI